MTRFKIWAANYWLALVIVGVLVLALVLTLLGINLCDGSGATSGICSF